MRNRPIILFAALIWLATLSAQASAESLIKRGAPVRQGRAWVESYECNAPAREGGKLILRADTGSIRIKTSGAGNRVECRLILQAYTESEKQARQMLDGYVLSARSIEGGGVYINGESSGSSHHRRFLGVGVNITLPARNSLGAEFDITLPARYNLDVETQGGEIGIEGNLQGEARLTTAGGDIRSADISGPVRVETAGGSITLGNLGVRAEVRTAGGSIHTGNVRGEAKLETSGGEIEVGQVGGSLRAETAGGDVVIGRATGQIVAETAGGQILLGPASSSVRAETAGGSIHLQGGRGQVVAETAGGSIDLLQVEAGVRASTAAGRILAQFNADAKTFAASRLETSSGDIFVYLPTGLPLTIDAAIDAAAGHRIITDFPLSIQGAREDFNERTIRGRGALNGGGEVLRIRTVAGNIEIRKLDPRKLQDLINQEQSSWNRWQERQAKKEQRQR